MPAVSNTSPLLNLAIINQLHLLQQRFVEVLIPPVVLAELKPGTDYPGTERIQHALDAQWLRVVELKDDTLARALRLELDLGEAAAIAIAIELSHTQILMDERDGRAKAKALGLQPVGILGVLLRAKLAGQIPSVETSLRALKNEAGFFIDDELYDGVLIEAGEK
jgi:predicted nucleic acid-binding protein